MSPYQRFHTIIRRIPRGRVATYGQVAKLAGLPAQARQVGYALAALSDDKIPWQRVINAKGEVSLRALPQDAAHQRERLEKEGIVFDRHKRVPLKRYQWKPTLKDY